MNMKENQWHYTHDTPTDNSFALAIKITFMVDFTLLRYRQAEVTTKSKKKKIVVWSEWKCKLLNKLCTTFSPPLFLSIFTINVWLKPVTMRIYVGTKEITTFCDSLIRSSKSISSNPNWNFSFFFLLSFGRLVCRYGENNVCDCPHSMILLRRNWNDQIDGVCVCVCAAELSDKVVLNLF